MKTNKNKTLPLIITFIWGVISYIFSRKLFLNLKNDAINHSGSASCTNTCAVLSRIIAFIIAITIIYHCLNYIYEASHSNKDKIKIILFSLPFILNFSRIILFNKINYYVGDEANIFYSAILGYPHYFVYTSELYIISLYIFPFFYGVVFFKILVTSFVAGYVIKRISDFFGYKYGIFVLLFFFIFFKPYTNQGLQNHRMQWYSLIYLYLATKLIFDYLEKNKINRISIIIISILFTLLSIWRREGIYLIVLTPFIIYFAYKGVYDFNLFKSITIYLLLIVLIWLPETYKNTIQGGRLSDGNVVYDATIIHMLDQEDFDRELSVKELDVINQYLDIGVIDHYNNDFENESGINSYYDAYWQYSNYGDGSYYAHKNKSKDSNYKTAIFKTIINQPLIYLKSRIKAFDSIRLIDNNISDNLYLPLLFCIITFIYCASNKIWIGFFYQPELYVKQC